MKTELEQIAVEINERHVRCDGLRLSLLYEARAIGDLLRKVKIQLGYKDGHGKHKRGEYWGWIRENCPFSKATAGDYVRIAREWYKITEYQQSRNGILNYQEALNYLRGHVTSEQGTYEARKRREYIQRKITHDWLSAVRNCSDGDLIDTLTTILAERERAEWILQQVADRIRREKKAAKLVG